MVFLNSQPDSQIKDYVKLLTAVGSLSRLFSDNAAPYLYYRAAENIFCKAFSADNKSRSDVSVDAVKDKTGIGLKTFLFKSSQFEKVAEFNKLSSEYSFLSNTDLVHFIADSRNARIETTNSLFELENSIYHCVARKPGKIVLYETTMDLINIPGIQNISENGNSIAFSDGLNQYSFNKSKSTLFKKFEVPDRSIEFDVSILEDPFTIISELGKLYEFEVVSPMEHSVATPASQEYVMLPLYSPNPREGVDKVAPRSGLNQWHAEGRERHPDEAYIPIPSWIHQKYPHFFPPKDSPFDLILPSNKSLSAKVCQENSKALMSNPNKDLGQWLLRNVLRLKPRELLTYGKLEKIGIDTVAIYKINNNKYEIQFKKLGTYEQFKADNFNNS